MRRPGVTPAPSVDVLVDREVDAVDELARKVRGGIRGPDHFDALEEEANGIAERLRAAFRGAR